MSLLGLHANEFQIKGLLKLKANLISLYRRWCRCIAGISVCSRWTRCPSEFWFVKAVSISWTLRPTLRSMVFSSIHEQLSRCSWYGDSWRPNLLRWGIWWFDISWCRGIIRPSDGRMGSCGVISTSSCWCLRCVSQYYLGLCEYKTIFWIKANKKLARNNITSYIY